MTTDGSGGEQQGGGVVEERRDQVVILRIDNVARRNALSLPVRHALLAALHAAEEDRDIQAVVITGAGDHFSAGGDLAAMEISNVAAARERLVLSHELVRTLARLSKPVIAAVEGWAAGAGLSLALACDLVVGAESSKYVASFGKVGLIGDLGLLRSLPQRVGTGRARRILFYAEQIQADEAFSIGLVDHLAPAGDALEEALRRAAAMLGTAPMSIAATKMLFADGLDQLLDRERELQSLLFLSADHEEGKAAFMERRPPRFRGH
jgi:2-(1,2-epoxy-1,2-dihydrophenyl)acetyl-CoA isomerase